MDFSDNDVGLNDLPFCEAVESLSEAVERLSEAGDLIEAGEVDKAVHVLAVALSSTIAEATETIGSLKGRVGELEARIAKSSQLNG